MRHHCHDWIIIQISLNYIGFENLDSGFFRLTRGTSCSIVWMLFRLNRSDFGISFAVLYLFQAKRSFCSLSTKSNEQLKLTTNNHKSCWVYPWIRSNGIDILDSFGIEILRFSDWMQSQSSFQKFCDKIQFS